MRCALRSTLLFVLVLFWASHASAISLTMAGADGQTVGVGDQVSISVTLDTEGTAGLTLLSVGVLFDDSNLSFNSGATTSASYALYNSGKGATTMTPPLAPALRFGTTNQVNVDFTCSDLSGGCGATGAFYTGGALTDSGTAGLLATLVFDVIGGGDGLAEISLSISSPGNVVQLDTGGTTASLAGAGTVVIPEPTTALLVSLGLAGLGIAGRRPKQG